MTNKKPIKLNEEVMEEIDNKLTNILEEMIEKHGTAIEEMFVCMTNFATELLDALEEVKSNKIVSPSQKILNNKMN